jgi:hypothetical protein
LWGILAIPGVLDWGFDFPQTLSKECGELLLAFERGIPPAHLLGA